MTAGKENRRDPDGRTMDSVPASVPKMSALRAAAASVSIVGHGSSWRVRGPGACAPHGVEDLAKVQSYRQAQRMAAIWRAQAALAAMGRLTPQARRIIRTAASRREAPLTTARALVDAALARGGYRSPV